MTTVYIVISIIAITNSFLWLEFTMGILNLSFILVVNFICISLTLFMGRYVPKPHYIYIIRNIFSVLMLLIIGYAFIDNFSLPPKYIIHPLGSLIGIFLLISANIDRLWKIVIQIKRTCEAKAFYRIAFTIAYPLVFLLILMFCIVVAVWGGFDNWGLKLGLINEKNVIFILAEEISPDKKITATYNIISGPGLVTDQLWLEIKSAIFPIKKTVFYDTGHFYILTPDNKINKDIPRDSLVTWESNKKIIYWEPFDREPRPPEYKTFTIPWYLRL